MNSKQAWILVTMYGATCLGMYLAYKHYLDTREQIDVGKIMDHIDKIVSEEIKKKSNGNGSV